MIKNGTEHLRALRDGRQVFINGEPIAESYLDAMRQDIERFCLRFPVPGV